MRANPWMMSFLFLDRLFMFYRRARQGSVFIFGTGGISEAYCKYCPLDVDGFLDNNPQNQGTVFLEKPVHAPASIQDRKESVFIIIASSYFEEIRNQLLEMGIGPRQIAVAYPETRIGVTLLKMLLSLFYLVSSPFAMVINAPISMVKTLWETRVLGNGQWDRYSAFNPFRGLNSFYYWPVVFNLKKYGRSGVAPYIGTGNYPLSRFFYFSLPSLYMYQALPVLTPLLGMFGWLAAFLIWSPETGALWISAIIVLLLFSTVFYYNTFWVQNYNSLGWMFFPAGLYAMLHGYWVLAAALWLLVSFSSITVLFIACLLAAVLSLHTFSLLPALCVVPAVLKMVGNVWPALSQKSVGDAMGSIGGLIGLSSRKAKYKRDYDGLNHLNYVYYILLYGQFAAASWLLNGVVDLLFLAGVAIYTLNTHWRRFADIQTCYLMMAGLAGIHMLEYPNWYMIPSFWLLISPAPHLLIPCRHPWIMPVFKPFDQRPFVSAMAHFLEPVPSRSTLLMALNDPKGNYGAIGDGYRHINELACGLAGMKDILFLPNWYAVSELNYEGAPDFWGRDVVSVMSNQKQWESDHVIIYQDKKDLDPQWQGAGFEVLSKLDWNDLKPHYKMALNERYYLHPPVWWLLRRPFNSSQGAN